ncbi:MAG: hypothetical protein R3B93_07905 [Bacteroidia bacterium]
MKKKKAELDEGEVTKLLMIKNEVNRRHSKVINISVKESQDNWGICIYKELVKNKKKIPITTDESSGYDG